MKKLLLLIILISVIGFAWYRLSLRPVDSADASRRPVTIASGLSVRGIGELLEEKGIIRSARAFSLYVRLHRGQGTLQAGDFALSPAMSAGEVADALQKGFSAQQSVTIPEGFTVSDIDALLASKGLIVAGDFITCAKTCDLSAYEFLPKGRGMAPRGGRVEGYLFPDTYMVYSQRFRSEDFHKRLLEEFKRRVAVDLQSDIGASKHPLREIVTMASLIEEEAKTNDERPVIAGILWKRLGAKTGLAVDATIRYALGKPTGALTKDDVDVDSAYNLRKYRGLPPGPISNAGLASIRAALHPKDSKYWYYLHGKDGVIRYAETNDEHNQNKQLYLR